MGRFQLTDEIKEYLLKEATYIVKADNEDNHKSTGFFIAPGLLLTTAHGVKLSEDEEDKYVESVRIYQLDGEKQKNEFDGKVVDYKPDSNIDLALIEVSDFDSLSPKPLITPLSDYYQQNHSYYCGGYCKDSESESCRFIQTQLNYTGKKGRKTHFPGGGSN